MGYDQVRKEIKGAGASMRCARLIKLLESLGFVVEGDAGHKKFKHPAIPSFYGSNFDCGHGKNPQVLRCYIRNVGKTLGDIEDEIRSFLKTK